MKHAIIVILFFVFVGLWSGAMNAISASLALAIGAGFIIYTYRQRINTWLNSALSNKNQADKTG